MRYTKDVLADALTGATNWSTVNVRLGRVPDARSAPLRKQAEEFGLDLSGIINPTARSYTDEALAEAVKGAQSWGDVRVALGKPRRAGASIEVMRRAAKRLGIDISHLDDRRRREPAHRNEEIVAKHADGATPEALAAEYGIGVVQVRRIIKALTDPVD